MPKELLDRIEKMDYLIKTRRTGTPDQFAIKIGVSVRMLHTYLAMFRERNAPIKYDREKCSYIYEFEGSFHFTFKEEKG
jgi:predicted DNA-binding transcriptional regulator YafY